MKNRKTILYFMIINFMFMQLVHGEWRASLYVNHAYDDNPFRLPETEESWISILNLAIQKDFSSVSLSYSGSFSRFQNMMERNYYWHQAALFGGSETVQLGIYAEQRYNRSDYEIYDYLTVNSYVNYQFNLAKFKLYWATDLEINNYKYLDEIDNFKFNSSIRFHKSFLTRTTIIGGGIINFKKYLNSYPQEILPGDSLVNLNMMKGPGNGPGGGGGQGQYPIYTYTEAPSVSQLRLWLRMAQSLTLTTGIAIQYQSSFLLNGSNRYVAGITYGPDEESRIFDDPMGYESNSIGTELTQILPENIILKGAFYLTRKNYSSQGIYLDEENYDENILRKDTYKTLWFRIQKIFTLNSDNNNSLILRLNYQWIDNQSNSYWYKYKNTYTSLGLEFQI